MNYPEHDKVSFFKYTSAETAVRVLESSKVIYRSPIEFNDPFDVQAGLHFEFDVEALPDVILAHIESLVALNNKPEVSEAEPFGELVIRLWEASRTQAFPKEKFREIARPLLVFLKEKTVLFQRQYQDAWWNQFLPRLRVFCVSETHDNLLMWSHYSEDHTGVVFEFRVLPEEDNPLCVAKPVEYCKSPPAFFSKKEWLDEIFGVRALDASALYFRYAYVKSDAWAYEKEWRVWDLLPRVEEKLHSYYDLRPDEVASVYLGCRINPDLKVTILRLLSGRPSSKVFQAHKAADDFRLDFFAL
jgi:hypothetical protein